MLSQIKSCSILRSTSLTFYFVVSLFYLVLDVRLNDKSKLLCITVIYGSVVSKAALQLVNGTAFSLFLGRGGCTLTNITIPSLWTLTRAAYCRYWLDLLYCHLSASLEKAKDTDVTRSELFHVPTPPMSCHSVRYFE